MTKPEILTCEHCGNKTPMRLLNKYEHVTTLELRDDYDIHYRDIFEVFQCPVCEGIQLVHTYWHSEDAYHEGFDIYEEHGSVLFPVNERIRLGMLPSNIKGAYESALKVKSIDKTICVMSLRRTLEMVCKDKGAVNGQLHQKLNELQQKGILPPLIGDISTLIKDFGNMAAHGDDVEFDRLLVESMFGFTNRILEYVYVLPREIKRAKSEMERLTGEELIETSSSSES
ncbi:DUF4145 domain-containing protein [Pseudalkalibacillus sp. A8]|uniref:DUF4145 domain-containing protein n=1 Tax=Pseudalkalibacillus sp. A8 TaxID=3382641 RepID=UPI0038B5F4B2